MLFHVSIDARDPQHVAHVLAELFGGEATVFPPVIEGSWLAMAGDDRNTAIEVYPHGTVIEEVPGDEDAAGRIDDFAYAVRGRSTHFAMATPLTAQQVHAIAEREGWTAKYRKRGGMFGVIEMWVENERMIEVLTAPMQAEYLEAMTLPKWKAMLEAGPLVAA